MSGVLPLLLTGYAAPILNNIVVTDIGSSTGAVLTLTAAIPAGSLICVTGVFFGSTATNLSVTTSGVALTWLTWQLPINGGIAGSNARTGFFAAVNSRAMAIGETLTLNRTGTGISTGGIQAFYATKIGISNPVDLYAQAFKKSPLGFAAATSPASLTGGWAATGTKNLLVYVNVVSAYYANPTTFTQTAGWTNPSINLIVGGTSGFILGSGYKIVSAGTIPAITNTTATISAGSYNPWSLQLLSFKEA